MPNSARQTRKAARQDGTALAIQEAPSLGRRRGPVVTCKLEGTAVERELQKLGVGVAKPSQVHRNRVSVLTPTTAARAAFHAQLWQCFSAQTWPNKELVVVETYDSTVEQPSSFFQDLKDDRLVHVALAHDLNVGLKRNISVLMASGEYCVNFDDDDFYADGYVERMVGELQLIQGD
ncbi:Acetyl-CoA acetyltransferase [Durusdinium trenchii]|uniref:Acetyl-CoA acetyltransferase n=1 Tax=Durusdinium trenchii TaxID=1381693 RepID=A0ABP0QSQ0_9DINO